MLYNYYLYLYCLNNNEFKRNTYQLKYGFMLKLYMFSSSIETFTYYSDYIGPYAIGFSLIFLNSNPKSVNDSSQTSSISGFFISNLSFRMFSFSVDEILFEISEGLGDPNEPKTSSFNWDEVPLVFFISSSLLRTLKIELICFCVLEQWILSIYFTLEIKV